MNRLSKMEATQNEKRKENCLKFNNCNKHIEKKLTVSQSPFLRVNIGTPPVAVKHIKCKDILQNH